MREVEVKAQLRNREEVLEALKTKGVSFSPAITQEDIVYVEKVGSLEVFLTNAVFVRVRETPTKVLFTVKYHPERGRAGEAHDMPIEHEVEVSSRKELTEMIRIMGFSEALRIRKTRQTGHYKDFEICIDEVESLGSFIELERLIKHDEETESVRKEMTEFLLTLGIASGDVGVDRYDRQLLLKQEHSKEVV